MSFADRPRPPRGPLLAAASALALLCAVALFGAVGGISLVSAPAPDPAQAAALAVVPSEPAPAVTEPPPLRLRSRAARLKRDQTLSQALAAMGVDRGSASAILGALRGRVDFSRLRPGEQLWVEQAEGEPGIRRFSFRQGPADEWDVAPEGSGYAAHRRPVDLSTQVERVTVQIQGSLYESLVAAGEDPALASLASDALAWDVDFYQDVRSGDRMSLLVEKVYADGQLLRYGDILAAEYDGAVASQRVYLWKAPDGSAGYYDGHGNSARRGFLRSPLRYTHLTSGYGMRMHPLLGYRRKHQGVDYGAPVGTPVWAVGDGVVLTAGWHGACGKMVAIRHPNGYTTEYCHLSRISVRAGQRVEQKQVIGLVGETGLATGPHLHFAVLRGGGFVNPLTVKLPRAAPLAARWRPEFERSVALLRSELSQGSFAAK